MMDSPLPKNDYDAHSTSELYSRWASTYDTDGNILQALDDIHLLDFLPKLVDTVETPDGRPLRILDLGCGTGRNTAKLLQAEWPTSMEVQATAWDASKAMLAVAKDKCAAITSPTAKLIDLSTMDLTQPSLLPEAHFDAISSTLVLEHVPLEPYFTAISRLLVPGGAALVTNMHPAMGATTQAGFKDEEGRRLKGFSYAHGVQESVAAAEAAGLQVVGDVVEGAVTDEVFDELKGRVREGGAKWKGKTIWYGMLLRKT